VTSSLFVQNVDRPTHPPSVAYTNKHLMTVIVAISTKARVFATATNFHLSLILGIRHLHFENRERWFNGAENLWKNIQFLS
jgi:hypothetical protein